MGMQRTSTGCMPRERGKATALEAGQVFSAVAAGESSQTPLSELQARQSPSQPCNCESVRACLRPCVCVCVASVFCIAQQHKQTPVSLSLSLSPLSLGARVRLHDWLLPKDVARYQWTTSPTELRVRLQTLLVGSPEPLSTEHMAVSILADLRCASCDDGLTHPSSLGHIARPQCNMLE